MLRSSPDYPELISSFTLSPIKIIKTIEIIRDCAKAMALKRRAIALFN